MMKSIAWSRLALIYRSWKNSVKKTSVCQSSGKTFEMLYERKTSRLSIISLEKSSICSYVLKVILSQQRSIGVLSWFFSVEDDFKTDVDLRVACLILSKQVKLINGNEGNILIPQNWLNAHREQFHHEQQDQQQQQQHQPQYDVKLETINVQLPSRRWTTVCSKKYCFFPCRSRNAKNHRTRNYSTRFNAENRLVSPAHNFIRLFPFPFLFRSARTVCPLSHNRTSSGMSSMWPSDQLCCLWTQFKNVPDLSSTCEGLHPHLHLSSASILLFPLVWPNSGLVEGYIKTQNKLSISIAQANN